MTKRIRDAIFVGLEESGDLDLPSGDVVRIRHLQTADQLAEAVLDGPPDLVVSVAPVDVAALRQRCPGFRSPVIVVDVLSAREQLTIHCWDESSHTHGVRKGLLLDLEKEIGRLCDPVSAPIPLPAGGLEQLGCSSIVEVKGTKFHVTTEVSVLDSIRVISVVWREGRIVERRASRVPRSESDAAVAEVVKRQHDDVVEAVLKEPPGA